jgi:hypothetical protein
LTERPEWFWHTRNVRKNQIWQSQNQFLSRAFAAIGQLSFVESLAERFGSKIG